MPEPELAVVVAAEGEDLSRLAQRHGVVVPARQLLYDGRARLVPRLFSHAWTHSSSSKLAFMLGGSLEAFWDTIGSCGKEEDIF